MAAEAARAAVPEAADGYAFNVPDTLKPFLGVDLKADPVIQAVQEHLHGAGKSQGAMDDLFGVMDVLAKKGLLEAPFDAKAERAQLGENGEARQRELETNLRALKDRGELDDGEFGELMSLVPTANGVKALEKLWRRSGGDGGLKPPGAAQDTASDAQTAARAMTKDPRYGRDPKFTAEADKAYQLAFP